MNLTPSVANPSSFSRRQLIGVVLGPLLGAAPLLIPAPAGLSPEGLMVAGIALMMATWWVTEPVPIPVTALLPMVLFPLIGVVPIADATASYAHPIVFLFLGGFILALGMERTGLHRRLAFAMIGALGFSPPRLIAAFLIATASLSMWVSNTATALMVLPIAISVVALIPAAEKERPAMKAFATALLLAVAYGATTGGMGTLIGTPPNAFLAAFVEQSYGITIGFGQWMLIGVPIVALALPLVYFALTRGAFRTDASALEGVAEMIATEKSDLGRLSRGELTVAIVFAATALAWITRPWLAGVIPGLSDTGIAIAGASLLFLLPTGDNSGERVMDWKTCTRLPWGVLLLFGGGLSLAGRIQSTGLSAWLGDQAEALGGLPLFLLIATLALGVLLLTELTSNTATAATFLPVVGAIAIKLGLNPLLLLVPTALAANCSYMMPVGTPPNAIVYGSGRIDLNDMVRTGVWLNLLLVPLITLIVLLLGPLVLGIEFDVLPAWAKSLSS
ncbi:DASS family sodium-coupled anion symporter [Opitutaceae bacterium]|nr:DASS family sodium-coupled anion symporter [Opitutaceae bacterium]